jgi:hypothetical protein
MRRRYLLPLAATGPTAARQSAAPRLAASHAWCKCRGRRPLGTLSFSPHSTQGVGVAGCRRRPRATAVACRARRPTMPRQPAGRHCPGLAAEPLRGKSFLLAHTLNVSLRSSIKTIKTLLEGRVWKRRSYMPRSNHRLALCRVWRRREMSRLYNSRQPGTPHHFRLGGGAELSWRCSSIRPIEWRTRSGVKRSQETPCLG